MRHESRPDVIFGKDMSYGVAITLGFSLVIYVVIRAILLGH
jgi:hypothetical protein